MSRDELLSAYRRLVLRELPERALREGWVVVNDHCFGRVVLDNTLGRQWYDVLGRRGRTPAFERLDDAQLATAVGIAEAIEREGDELLRELNARSLAWRGKG